jgi:hypothetical protein
MKTKSLSLKQDYETSYQKLPTKIYKNKNKNDMHVAWKKSDMHVA